jgi:hypothetical protein
MKPQDPLRFANGLDDNLAIGAGHGSPWVTRASDAPGRSVP